MLIRIVRMTFYEDKVGDFLQIFEESKYKIRAFPGCSHLELHQDCNANHVFSTYSYWDNEEAINKYRNSGLFKSVWSRTKALFAEKTMAFSHKLVDGPVMISVSEGTE